MQATASLRLLRFDDACEAMGLPRRTAERLLKRGQIPKPFRLGRTRYYAPQMLADFIESKAAAGQHDITRAHHGTGSKPARGERCSG